MALHPEKPLLYASPLILKRRNHVLHCAREMIATDGIEDFSVRELCRRAGVAYATFYNAFHDKDRLVALAIAEVMNAPAPPDIGEPTAGSLLEVINHTVSFDYTAERNRNMIKAIVSIYFSPSTSEDVWRMLRAIAVRKSDPWLAAIANRGGLSHAFDLDEFDTVMANSLYSAGNDWCLGRVSDHAFVYRVAEIMLLLIADVVQGRYHDEAVGYLHVLRQTGDFTRLAEAAGSS